MAKKCRQNEPSKGKNRRLRQSSSSYANYEDLSSDEDVGKDFGVLVNAPISKGGHFVFKSEKLWSVDTSLYSEFFTLNLKTLSAAIDCIPFNEYIDVDDKYFTVSMRDIARVRDYLLHKSASICVSVIR